MLTLHPGDTEFPASEYAQRVERAKERMAELGVDALMVTGDFLSAFNYRYFTGHLPRDFQTTTDRTHVFVLTREGGAAICSHPESLPGAKRSWVSEVSTYQAPFRHTAAIELFTKLGLTRGTVAAEIGDGQRLQMPVLEYERLKAALPNVTWVDVGPIAWALRMVKSEAELDRIARADRINGAAIRRAFARAVPGGTERDVYAEAVVGIVEGGALRPPHEQITIRSSARARDTAEAKAQHGAAPVDVPFVKGDLLFLDTGCQVDGYWAEFTRMVAVGEPTDQQRHFHSLLLNVDRGWWEEILRPGVTCNDAMEKHLARCERLGLAPEQYRRDRLVNPPRSHHCHGIGLSSSEQPRVRIGDMTALRPGMVLSVESYVVGDGFLYGTEENVVITDDGARLITDPIDRGLTLA
jgi:Xaa-Pro aminopeptidase